jgi:hypothetical protein
MKKLILAIIFLSSINIYSQKYATLYFRNGDSLKVISSINSGNKRITYKETKDAKRITVDYKKIIKAVQHYDSFDRTFVFKIKDGYQNPVILERFYSGRVYLYKMDFNRQVNNGYFDVIEYYVCKDDTDVVTTFNASGIFIENGFRKKSREFFKDCPELVKKINDKTWKMKDIPEIVRFYNTDCN